ncbi:unnamed protein product, partial [Didymodactylos carnosus]
MRMLMNSKTPLIDQRK